VNKLIALSIIAFVTLGVIFLSEPVRSTVLFTSNTTNIIILTNVNLSSYGVTEAEFINAFPCYQDIEQRVNHVALIFTLNATCARQARDVESFIQMLDAERMKTGFYKVSNQQPLIMNLGNGTVMQCTPQYISTISRWVITC